MYVFFFLFSVVLVSYLRIYCQIQDHEDLLLCFLSTIHHFTTYLSCWSIFTSFLYMMWDKDQNSLSCISPPSCPRTIISTLFFSIEWSPHPCWKSVQYRQMVLFLESMFAFYFILCKYLFLHMFYLYVQWIYISLSNYFFGTNSSVLEVPLGLNFSTTCWKQNHFGKRLRAV